MGDRNGFTLIEVLVSLSILAATLLLTYRVISGAISAADRSERWTAASYLAEAMILDAVDEFPETTETRGNFPPPNESYSWKRTVRPASHADAREVEVVVLWTSGDREERVSVTGLAVKR
jgi:type II secretion system protein I